MTTTLIVEALPGDAWMSLGQHLINRCFGTVTIATAYGSNAELQHAERYAHSIAGARWRSLELGLSPDGQDLPYDLFRELLDERWDRVLAPLGFSSLQASVCRECTDRVHGTLTQLYVELPAAIQGEHQRELTAELDAVELPILSARARLAEAGTGIVFFPARRDEAVYLRDHPTLELILGDPE